MVCDNFWSSKRLKMSCEKFLFICKKEKAFATNLYQHKEKLILETFEKLSPAFAIVLTHVDSQLRMFFEKK